MNSVVPPMLGLLRGGIEAGGFQTDDVLATVLPLFRQTLAAHEAGFVAPLECIEAIELTADQRLGFSETKRRSVRQNNAAVAKAQEAGPKAVQIVGSFERQIDLDTGGENAR